MFRFASWILVTTLVVRALIPVGYMPGNLLAGEFMVPCPSSPVLQTGHHHHKHGAGERSVTNETCPIGQAVQQAALTSLPVIPLELDKWQEQALPVKRTMLPGPGIRRLPIRGPPVLLEA